jgi:copper chaperone CopZ
MKKTATYDAPALYGDHHVIEIRRLLFEMPGVEDVYASSAFHSVDVTYDSEKVQEEAIEHVLEQAGYLGALVLPQEGGIPTYLCTDKSESFFRHTDVYETSRKVVGFSQNVHYSGRPLWNCPGFGVIKGKMEE